MILSVPSTQPFSNPISCFFVREIELLIIPIYMSIFSFKKRVLYLLRDFVKYFCHLLKLYNIYNIILSLDKRKQNYILGLFISASP